VPKTRKRLNGEDKNNMVHNLPPPTIPSASREGRLAQVTNTKSRKRKAAKIEDAPAGSAPAPATRQTKTMGSTKAGATDEMCRMTPCSLIAICIRTRVSSSLRILALHPLLPVPSPPTRQPVTIALVRSSVPYRPTTYL